MSVQRSLLLILTSAMDHAESILALIDSLGFYAVSSKRLVFNRERAEQYFSTSKFTEAQMEHLCSGPVQCVLLSKVGAINSLMNVCGMQFDEPSDARDRAPQTLRALYGIDRARSGVRCSVSVESALREIACVFPTAPPRQLSAEQYLQQAIMPGLAEAIAEISAQRPVDPIERLQQWLLLHRPVGEKLYESEVLKGYVLRVDGGSSRTSTNAPDSLRGVRNFRKCNGPSPIYGMAQVPISDMTAVADSLLNELGHTSVLFINVREEPVVFVDGIPHTIRHPDRPFQNVSHFAAVQGHELLGIERKLALEVRGQAAAQSGTINTLGLSGSLEPTGIDSGTSILSMAEAYDTVSRHFPQVSFRRIPFPSGQSPDDSDIQDIVEAVKGLSKGGCIVFQCDSGKGRATLCMAMADMVWNCLMRCPVGGDNANPTHSQDAASTATSPVKRLERKRSSAACAAAVVQPAWLRGLEQPDLPDRHASYFRPVEVLLDNLQKKYGPLLPAVEASVRNASAILNFGTAVADALDAASNYVGQDTNDLTRLHRYRGDNDQVWWMNLAASYLKRYCQMIVLAAYLAEHAPGFHSTFRAWHRKHWSVELPIRTIRFENQAQAEAASPRMKHLPCH
jgi:nucleoside diphosphate kinase